MVRTIGRLNQVGWGSCHHLSINLEGRWGATDDFTTSFLHFFPVLHCPLGLGELQACPSLMLSSHLFLCLPCPLPLSLCLARWVWPEPDERETCSNCSGMEQLIGVEILNTLRVGTEPVFFSDIREEWHIGYWEILF